MVIMLGGIFNHFCKIVKEKIEVEREGARKGCRNLGLCPAK